MQASDPGKLRSRGSTQKRILEFIKNQVDTRGYPPSVREIGEAVGLKSTSTVHGHLSRMERKGLLRRDAMKPRAMELVSRDGDDREGANVRMVPLLGAVAAGAPILAEESIGEQIPIPLFMLAEKGTYFALTIRGDSMVSAGIFDRDYVVVRRQSDAGNGDIVVAMIDGEATVKRFFRENGCFRLQPENPAMQPILTTAVEILGKVISVCRVL